MGGSGSSRICTSMSPACSAFPAFCFFAQAPRRTRAETLMRLFTACLRRSLEPQVGTDRALQFGEALFVHREVRRQVQLVHAQVARTVEDHDEARAPCGVARLRALDRLPRDRNELVM